MTEFNGELEAAQERAREFPYAVLRLSQRSAAVVKIEQSGASKHGDEPWIVMRAATFVAGGGVGPGRLTPNQANAEYRRLWKEHNAAS